MATSPVPLVSYCYPIRIFCLVLRLQGQVPELGIYPALPSYEPINAQCLECGHINFKNNSSVCLQVCLNIYMAFLQTLSIKSSATLPSLLALTLFLPNDIVSNTVYISVIQPISDSHLQEKNVLFASKKAFYK